jgi:hypothetical protein
MVVVKESASNGCTLVMRSEWDTCSHLVNWHVANSSSNQSNYDRIR